MTERSAKQLQNDELITEAECLTEFQKIHQSVLHEYLYRIEDNQNE